MTLNASQIVIRMRLAFYRISIRSAIAYILGILLFIPFLLRFDLRTPLETVFVSRLLIPLVGEDFLESFPLVLAIEFAFFVLCSTLIWHLLLHRTIFGTKPPMVGRIILGASDYLWYGFGAFLILLVVNEYQIGILRDFRKSPAGDADRFKELAHSSIELEETASACLLINQAVQVESEIPIWVQDLCDDHFISKEDRELFRFLETCQNTGETFYISEGSRFFANEILTQELADALNQIHGFCVVHVMWEQGKSSADEIGVIIEKTRLLPERGDALNAYLLVFTFILGGKFAKTTNAVTRTLRNKSIQT